MSTPVCSGFAAPVVTRRSEKNNRDGEGETIIVLRYDETQRGSWFPMSRMSLLTAICNARQYPYTSLSIFGPGQSTHDLTGTKGRASITIDDLAKAVLTACGLENEGDPWSYFRLLNGEADEVKLFENINPDFFFINCTLSKHDITKGTTIDEALFVPVFKMGGKYFMFGGQKKCRLYKIMDPHWLFFTIFGHKKLTNLLTAPYNGQFTTVVLETYLDYRPRRLLCIPAETIPKAKLTTVNWNKFGPDDIRRDWKPYPPINNDSNDDVIPDQDYMMFGYEVIQSNSREDIVTVFGP